MVVVGQSGVGGGIYGVSVGQEGKVVYTVCMRVGYRGNLGSAMDD